MGRMILLKLTFLSQNRLVLHSPSRIHRFDIYMSEKTKDKTNIGEILEGKFVNFFFMTQSKAKQNEARMTVLT